MDPSVEEKNASFQAMLDEWENGGMDNSLHSQFLHREVMRKRDSPHDEEITAFWRKVMSERCPAILAKYGRFASIDDVTDEEAAQVSKAIVEVSQNKSEEQALSLPKKALILADLTTWYNHSSHDFQWAGYSAVGGFGASPKFDDHVVVYSLKWRPTKARSDPSLAFKLIEARVYTYPQLATKFELGREDFRHESVDPSSQLGLVHTLLTTADSAASFDELIIEPHSFPLQRLAEKHHKDSPWSDPEWERSLKHRLTLSNIFAAGPGYAENITARRAVGLPVMSSE
ncbi:hypothetical protein RQP46_009986 [Phenoliferia psychrophenolica]